MESLVGNLNGSLTTFNELYNRKNQNFTLKEDFEKRTRLIIVNTFYKGELYKKSYQFNLGSNINNYEHPSNTGFLMPYSGRIKRITSRIQGVSYFNVKTNDAIFTLYKFKLREKKSIPLIEYFVTSTKEEEGIENYDRFPLRSSDNYLASWFTGLERTMLEFSEGDLINLRTNIDHF